MRSSHLTRVGVGANGTRSGMFHFAGGGPAWATCGKCAAFCRAGGIGGAAGRPFEGEPSITVHGVCNKVKEYTNRWGKPFPSNSLACKYFIKREN
ncbi:hypothetical protein BLTE_13610 [Blastochloris tepida]|uniref:Uncharacterized protein n=1 Tax=Blastochloris tepida TaxID=2233851 RepID=A0A348FZE3_9HYPH|nr:hypothetical protein BLTE_13610 [Blastochloris tepida]